MGKSILGAVRRPSRRPLYTLNHAGKPQRAFILAAAMCTETGAGRWRIRQFENALLRDHVLQALCCFVWRLLAGSGHTTRISLIAIERGSNKVTEPRSSARIIDLAAYRSEWSKQQAAVSTAPSQGSGTGPFATGAPMPLCWFWPTWVWMPIPVPAMSPVQWDAS